jgi:DNA-directed RNA polymerase specialized sigma24 family protein
MIPSELTSHLSRIATRWTMLLQAHQGAPDAATAARSALAIRYGGAVHRYLLKVAGDPDAADELAQEFALRLLRGDFRNADPSRGRFRDFLKRAVRNLLNDHFGRLKGRARPLGGDRDEAASTTLGPGDHPLDQQFLESWRDELFDRAWGGLARHEERTGQRLHTVLRLRAEHPDLSSPRMAEVLSAALGRPLTAVWVRQILRLARERFVDLLLEDVSASLDFPARDRVEQELIDLGLLEYCRSGLERCRWPQDQELALG